MSLGVVQKGYSKDEFARRGQELYNQQIKPLVEPSHHGKVVAIDVETGDYAIDEDVLRACASLKESRPEAKIWTVRAGYPTLHKLRIRPLQKNND